jgi:hypothetical protein
MATHSLACLGKGSNRIEKSPPEEVGIDLSPNQEISY